MLLLGRLLEAFCCTMFLQAVLWWLTEILLLLKNVPWLDTYPAGLKGNTWALITLHTRPAS